MAQQKGIIPLKGTIGNITFYKSRDGYLAREKSGLDGNRIANDPAFARTRENGAEFGRAGKAGKLLRSSIRSLLLNTADSRMIARLTREMMRVIQADAVNDRGQRNVLDGETELLQGFEFNANSKLSTVFFAPFTQSLNRTTGVLDIVIPPFVPATMIAAPGGATHYKLVSAGVELNFEQEQFTAALSNQTAAVIDGSTTAPLTLTHSVTANSTHPLLLVLGIEFYQEVNGQLYPLKNGAFNALAVVAVSGQ